VSASRSWARTADDIVDYTVFLTDPSDLYELDQAMTAAMPSGPPTRTVIPSKGFALPRREGAFGHEDGAPRMEMQFPHPPSRARAGEALGRGRPRKRLRGRRGGAGRPALARQPGRVAGNEGRRRQGSQRDPRTGSSKLRRTEARLLARAACPGRC